MPAVLVGYLNPSIDSGRWKRLAEDCPRHIVDVSQQAGGMAMSYPEGFGVLLRLAGNVDHAHGDAAHLVRGFHCMAEDPNFPALRADYPALYRLCATWGESYTQEQLALLSSVVNHAFTLPKPVAGLEAFVEFEEADILEFFEGWRCVETSECIAQIEAEQRTYGELWADGRRFDQTTLEELAEFGRQVGVRLPIRAALLWENSD